MVSVEKYIRKLLFEYDCVIIPDFGGLLTHYIGAHYDTNNAVFYPSTKRIAFNEVLRIDDGLLAYYISINEKVLREEAYQMIKKFTESLRLELKEGKTVQLGGIGSFTANSEGKPVFEPDYHQNFSSEWYGFEGVEAHYVESAHTDTEYVIETDTAELADETALVVFKPAKKRRKWLGWAAAAIISGAVVAASIIYRPVDNSMLSTLNPVYGINQLYISAVSNFSKPSIFSKSSATQVAPVSHSEQPVEVIAPINAPDVKNETLELRPVVESTAPIKIEETAAPEVVPTNTYTGKYFLIAGSFGKMRNARILQKQLIRNGFVDAQVLDNTDGKLIKVAAGNYQSTHLAMEDKDKVDEITGAESWIYKKK